jgi:membrane fusion protein (multidrug efflux system)
MAPNVTIDLEEQATTVDLPAGDLPAQRVDSAPGKKLSVRKLSRARILVPAIGLVFAATAAMAYHSYAGWESTDDAQIDGYINPISSRVSGYITHVYVDDNQYVKAGTLLVQIDPKDYQVALDSARASLINNRAKASASQVNIRVTSVNASSELASAQANVMNARAGISGSEKQLAAARAALLQAEANQAKAQDDVKRFKQLVDKQEIPEQRYVQAVQTASGAEAAVEAARANVQASQDAVRQAHARLDKALASLESARTGSQQVRIQQSRAIAATALAQKSQSAVEQAALNLNYTRIVAPVDGLVAKRSAQPGQYVQPGQRLMAIVPLDDLWVTANFKETQLKNIRPDEPAEIYVDAYGRDYKGHVESIAGGTGAVFSLLPPENATGNYVKVVQRIPVRLRIDRGQDSKHLLRPGMSVEPRVKVK